MDESGARQMLRYFLIIGVVLFAFVGLASVVWGDATDRYVPETGHVIEAHFVAFYDKHGGRQILGDPLTDAFIDPKSGLLIQYFENARLELISGEKTDWTVQLAPLGQMIFGWDQPSEDDLSQPSPGCRFFPEARFSVCHAFLDFFEQHGGVEVFGLPISSNRIEDGNLTQLFQRFRLEWVADDSSDHAIRISPLGRIHFGIAGYNPELLQPTLSGTNIPGMKEELHIETSLSTPLLEAGATQVVYVTVRDDDLNPLEGASTLLTAHFQSGPQYILLPVTDENGVTSTHLTADEFSTNSEVLLEFLVQYDDMISIARDSFLIR
jgi:hypothetical protein